MSKKRPHKGTVTLKRISCVSVWPLKCSWKGNTFPLSCCDWNFRSKWCPSTLAGLLKDGIKEHRKLIIWILVALHRVLNHTMKCYTSGLWSCLRFHTEGKKKKEIVLRKGIRVITYTKQAYKICYCDKSSCGIFSSKLIVIWSSDSSECTVESNISHFSFFPLSQLPPKHASNPFIA